MNRLKRRHGLLERFEFVNPSVRHQRQKQVTVLDDVRSDVCPLLHDQIVQGASGGLGTGER